MARTTPAKVKKIVAVDEAALGLDVTLDLTPFIDAANELVTEVCASATNEDGSDYYTSTRLEMIETWLAAHFYCILAPQAKFEGVGPVQESFDSKVDLGLDVTKYGQQAKRLDTFGGLAALDAEMKKGGKIRMRARWLGKTHEEIELES